MVKLKVVLLADIGSTYTKVTAVDVKNDKVLGTASAFTTVETNMNEGLETALKRLKEKAGVDSFF